MNKVHQRRAGGQDQQQQRSFELAQIRRSPCFVEQCSMAALVALRTPTRATGDLKSGVLCAENGGVNPEFIAGDWFCFWVGVPL